MRVSTEGYGWLTRVLLRIARDCAQGRFAAVLEGGYDLPALVDSVGRVLAEMGGELLDQPVPAVGAPAASLARIRAAQGRYWELPEG